MHFLNIINCAKYSSLQKVHSSFSTGSITVKIQFLSEHLKIHIMNCRHLKPGGNLRRSRSEILKQETKLRSRRCSASKSNNKVVRNISDTKMDFLRDKCHSLQLSVSEARHSAHRRANHGMCRPYVTIKLVPGQPGSGADHRAKFKTNSQPRTLFPIFDETFFLQITKQISKEKSFLLFSVKDRGPLGDKILLGEALVSLTEIKKCDQGCRMQDMEQIHLPLTLPSTKNIDILTALNTRKYDERIMLMIKMLKHLFSFNFFSGVHWIEEPRSGYCNSRGIYSYRKQSIFL